MRPQNIFTVGRELTKIYIVGLNSHHLITSLISDVSELNWLTQVDDEILGVTE